MTKSAQHYIDMPKEIWSTSGACKKVESSPHTATAQALRAGLLANAQSISWVRWCIREKRASGANAVLHHTRLLLFSTRKRQVDLTQKEKKKQRARLWVRACESVCERARPTAYLVKQTRHMYNLDVDAAFTTRETHPFYAAVRKVQKNLPTCTQTQTPSLLWADWRPPLCVSAAHSVGQLGFAICG
jgi:hypothetical protein